MTSRVSELPIQLATGPVVLGEPIGSGGSAQVWAVASYLPERPYEGPLVLKVGRADSSRYLASEAERLTLACSTRLPTPYDVGRLPQSGLALPQWHGAPYLLMRRLPGRSLSQVIVELRQPLASFREERQAQLGIAVARDIGAALADLHEAGVAHGDVKPDNVVVNGDGTGGAPWRCSLCDLGLATTGDQLLGATPQYLPPEVNRPELGPSNAKARDLWALGKTLLQALGMDGGGQPPLTDCPQQLRPILEGLLAETAAARPRARWVSLQTGGRATAEERSLAVRRRYLAAHEPFLEMVTQGHPSQGGVPGIAGAWLEEAGRLLSRIPELIGAESATRTGKSAARATELSSHERKRFLVSLCGVAAIDFSPLPSLDEGAFVERLLRASKVRAPEAFTFDLFSEEPPTWLDEGQEGLCEHPSEGIQEPDLVAVALELGSERPDPFALLRAERASLTGAAPLSFTIALSQALKRQGELGRARTVLLHASAPEAQVALAGVTARSGAVAEALAVCVSHVANPRPNVASAAAALGARLHLARGEVVEAAALLDGAALIHGATATAAVFEARASVALSHRNRDAARDLLFQAQSLPCDAEQQARLSALWAHLEHQSGNHDGAFKGYVRAAADAARAGAIVEEATYLVGVASTAVHLGKTADALDAAARAELLFEVIDNPAAQARSALNRASSLAVVGAVAEACTAAADAVQRSHRVKDVRCEALGHLLLCTLGARELAADHWKRAEALLSPLQAADELRLAACAGQATLPLPTDAAHLDEVAVQCPDVEVQLEWWAARLRSLATGDLGSSRGAAERALAALSRLMTEAGPIDGVGQAYAAGAEVAAMMGDGDRSLQFLAIAREAHRKIVDGAPQDLKLSARQLPWALWVNRHSGESPLRAEQIGEIERLIKELADRSRLGSVLERSLDALIRWTGVERGLLLMNAPDGKLIPRAARNLARQDLSAEHRQLSQTLARRALETGDCVVAVDASGELPSLHHSVHALKLRSVLAVPLVARGETVGVVYLDDRIRRGAFGPSELAWVRLVGTIAAVAIADARDQARLRRSARRALRAEQRLSEHLTLAKTELGQAKVALSGQNQVGRHGLVGNSPPMQTLYNLIDRVGSSQVPVLLFGESGTGKELVAKAIHRVSPRKDKPFISENCSAIPAPLLESILFGHKRGAFTGAVQNHVGLFETASGGTLFLDELGEMSLPMQAKLLRVLESGELRRVGDDRVLKVDVRILGASHRNLETMVEQGSFREDLYYRLNVITLRLPPLRERAADIPLLVQHFLSHARGGSPLPIAAGALSALQLYGWPGNVRQLENELRRASVLADGCITLEHLSPAVMSLDAALPASAPSSLNLKQQVDALESQLIERALREASGNQSRAAEALGVSRFGLQKMLKRLGLNLPK